MSTAVFDFDTRRSTPQRVRRTTATTRRVSSASMAPSPSSSSPSSSSSGVRLTRRGRVVVLLVGVAAAFGAFTMVSDPAVSTSQEHQGSHEQVVVEPGQSLWDIAGTIAPGEDPRAVIAEIVDLNALQSSGAIQAGQLLYVPSA